MENKDKIKDILEEIQNTKKWKDDSLQKILRKRKKANGRMFRKDELVEGYLSLKRKDHIVEERIRMKPTRTNSGVVTVTVLTKPYPCPGTCIFCPNDPTMPKSYISSEPGAQRALKNKFDPYAQVYNRLIALKNIGHNIQKVELLILGGSWSHYVRHYQLAFVYECFRALNDIQEDTIGMVKPLGSLLTERSFEDLISEQKMNEKAYCRNVGLVLETRPDLIVEEEVEHMRRLGCTKVQIGIQSLSDRILRLNRVRRKTKDVEKAFEILRRYGFKIHAHWMPNLYGSYPLRDVIEFRKLWSPRFSPDELKIYPTSIIKDTYLYDLYKRGKYKPYTEKQLKYVLKNAISSTPRYCRLSRIVRDIPSNEIVDGNKKTNLRQIVEEELIQEGRVVQDIRAREIKDESVTWEKIKLETIQYSTKIGKEIFLSYKTKVSDKICGFLRLSIPNKRNNKLLIDEIRDSTMIREIHVYGKVLGIKDLNVGESQHLGLGKRMIGIAEEITRQSGFKKISVISAIGTRQYYRDRGFQLGDLYMSKTL